MVFAKRAAGQAAGHPFFGSFLWSEQRNERKKGCNELFQTHKVKKTSKNNKDRQKLF